MTSEEKAKQYADGIHMIAVPGTIIENTIEDVNMFAQCDYLAGYNEAMRWRDPKVELPKEGVDVFVKIKRSGDCGVEILYTSSAVVNDFYHSKHDNPFGCEGYFPSGNGGRVRVIVIGWKPIE